MAGHWGLCLPWFLYLLLTWADFCASVNPHWFSWEWNVIIAASCIHQVYWRAGSLGFCVISSATNVSCDAFFSRGCYWLSGLVTSSAPNSALGSHTTSSVFILTQLRCGKPAQYKPFPGQMLEEPAQNQEVCGWTRNWAQVFSAYGWNGLRNRTSS